MIDLHVHTTASDGSFTPKEVVQQAALLGMRALAVTDHDTVEGYEAARQAGEQLGVEIILGIELSTKYERAVHILGYYIDMRSPALKDTMEWLVADRDKRNQEMARLMAADGLPVSYEQMQKRFGTVIGRPHFAALLVELGYAESVKDAFARYVEKGQRYYQGRTILEIERVIALIDQAGGVPVLAHPFQYRMDDTKLRELIEHCIACGLRGIECRYTGYDEAMVNYLENLAAEYGLIRTGGSDFHGTNKPHITLGKGLGQLRVPDEYLQELKACAKK